MQIIHLSDTHIGHPHSLERCERLLDALEARFGHAPRPWLIHTGDLTDRADATLRRQARRWLGQLRECGYPLRLCPGNHDVGGFWRVDVDAAAAFADELADHLFAGGTPQFPVLTECEDTVLLGLDSNAGELSWWHGWWAEGQLGEPQLQRLRALLTRLDGDPRRVLVYLHHHPFIYGYSVAPDVGDGHLLGHWLSRRTRAFRRLKDAYSLLEALRDRADMLLFGHHHHGLDCSGDSRRYGIPLALDAGSSTAVGGAGPLRYRVIDTVSRSAEAFRVPL